MRSTTVLGALAATLVMSMSVPASAAPATSALRLLDVSAAKQSNTEQVNHRRGITAGGTAAIVTAGGVRDATGTAGAGTACACAPAAMTAL
jgi:hypothetical protein